MLISRLGSSSMKKKSSIVFLAIAFCVECSIDAMEPAPKRQKIYDAIEKAVDTAQKELWLAVTNKGLGRFSHLANAIEALRGARLPIDTTLRIPDCAGLTHGHKTMLSWVAYYQEPDLVASLLEQGAGPNSLNHYKRSPLHEVFMNYRDIKPCAQQEVVSELLVAGASVESYDTSGYQPIHYAAMLSPGGWRCFSLLISKGAHVNAPVIEHGTPHSSPLHGAIDYHKHENVRMLLAHGASLGIKNLLGQTAKELAEEINQIGVMDGFDPSNLLDERVMVEDWIETGVVRLINNADNENQ